MSEGIESKLGAILSDPSAMAGIMNIVKGLSGDTKPHEGGDTYESKADADKSRVRLRAAYRKMPAVRNHFFIGIFGFITQRDSVKIFVDIFP